MGNENIACSLMYSVRNRGRPNFVFFLFFGARKRLFLAEKDIQIFVFFSFFGIKMAVKKNKKKSVLWLNQCTAGRTLCHLQLHTAAVYIATRRASVLWAVSRLSLLSLLLQSACDNSPFCQKILVGATNKCCQRTTIQCRWTDLFWLSK